MSLFYEAAEILACLPYYIYSVYVLGIFFKKSASYRSWILVAFGIIYLPLTATPYQHISNAVMSLVCMLVIFIVSLICYEGNPVKKIMTIIVYNIFDILLGNILFYFISGITKTPISRLTSGMGSTRIYLLCTGFFIEFFILFLIREIHGSSQRLHKTEAAISLIFFLCDFTVCFMTYYVLFYLTQEKNVLRFCLVLSVLMLAATLLVLWLLGQLQKKTQNDFENKMMSMQLQEQKALLAQTQEGMEKILQLRHDMKNYLLQYKLLLEKGKSSEVLEDLEKMLGHRISAEDISYTKHPLVNSLLKHKYETAKKLHIPFHVRVQIHPEYQNLDLMVALSNLIDNAIEAECAIPEQFRAISVEMIERDGHLSILIQNRITASVLAVNPDLKSSKRNGIHGIGLNSVRRIVESQDGLIDIFEENEKFCVHIFYPRIQCP